MLVEDLLAWGVGWRKGKRRTQAPRDARVPGEPRPTTTASIERDGVKCWRCGEDCDIDKEAECWEVDPETGRGTTRNLRYRTVGHVSRIVDGGKDTMANARLECWECNSSDGVVAMGEELGRMSSAIAAAQQA